MIWQSSVHSWEVELYQDLVFRDMENSRKPKKRSAPTTSEEQTPRPAKRRKASHEGTVLVHPLMYVTSWYVVKKQVRVHKVLDLLLQKIVSTPIIMAVQHRQSVLLYPDGHSYCNGQNSSTLCFLFFFNVSSL